MEFECVLQKRVSCRKYNGKIVEKDKIAKILNQMVLAPTARHLQSYKVKVFDGVSVVGKVSSQAERVFGASNALVFFAEKDEFFAIQDATIVCAYAQLVATDEGLAALWIGVFDEEKVRFECGVDANLKPVAILVVGYSDEILVRPVRKEMRNILI